MNNNTTLGSTSITNTTTTDTVTTITTPTTTTGTPINFDFDYFKYIVPASDYFSISGYLDKKNMIDKNGYIYIGNMKIMPSVKEIKIIHSNDMAVGVKVIFSDDSVEKAICDKEDTFNYDYGLAICIMKKLFSYMSGKDKFTGTYYFNKIMDLAFRNNLKTFKEHAEEDRKKEQEKHRKEKNRIRKERQKKAKKEAEIEIQKEAYIRAMRELKEDK